MENTSASVSGRVMRRIFMILTCIFLFSNGHSQNPNDLTREINRKLKVLSTPSPDVAGGYVFNNSYEGMKGGPFFFDNFIQVRLRVEEIDYYIPIEANLDLKSNTVLYKDPESGQIYSIPSERVAEIIAEAEDDTLVFKTTEDKEFDPALREIRFMQVLKGAPDEFVKVPYKIFVPADYTGAYTAKRRYDEYKAENDYFILTSNNVYKQVKLTKNSLIRIFPEKKDLIRKSFDMKTQSEEEIALSVMDN